MHARQQIRASVAAILTPNSAGAGVYPGRSTDFQAGDLPALTVHTDRETVSDQTTVGRPRQQWREVELVVTGYTTTGGEVDDALDALAVEVETLLAADNTLGGLARDCWLLTSSIERDTQSTHAGAITLTYRVSYIVTETDPETLIP